MCYDSYPKGQVWVVLDFNDSWSVHFFLIENIDNVSVNKEKNYSFLNFLTI